MPEWIIEANDMDSIADGNFAFVGTLLRCRDCKWYDLTHPYGTVIPDAFHCKANDRFYGETHFCAYGERKE